MFKSLVASSFFIVASIQAQAAVLESGYYEAQGDHCGIDVTSAEGQLFAHFVNSSAGECRRAGDRVILLKNNTEIETYSAELNTQDTLVWRVATLKSFGSAIYSKQPNGNTTVSETTIFTRVQN